MALAWVWASTVQAEPSQQHITANTAVFSYDDVVAMARKLAAHPYVPPAQKLPQVFQDLSYDQYRDIRFRPDQAIWHGTGLPFQVELFHRGLYYPDKVNIYLVENGKPFLVPYSPSLFTFGPLVAPSLQSAAAPAVGPKGAAQADDLGFAGLRIHAPMNRPDYYDEVAVFLGASYFRSLARGEVYGLSARGLALKTAEPTGEEFPRFTTFWIERPDPDAGAIVLDALLDSQSVAGAYRFSIRPGAATVMDVKATLFPRVALDKVGIAPMSSMFFFGPNDHADTDDFRPAVHDSEGLAMYSGAGEWIWRPLSNPTKLQVSAFVDQDPKGFGLMQRSRQFADYEDLEASYERRPSLWVSPKGNWGPGHIILIEIPTDAEIHDNIVAFWRPDAPIPTGKPTVLDYDLSWADTAPIRPPLSLVLATRIGRTREDRDRLIVIDFGPEAVNTGELSLPDATVTASAGKVSDVVVEPNPHTGGWRLSFHLDPGTADLVELRTLLTRNTSPVSETWLYRWTRG